MKNVHINTKQHGGIKSGMSRSKKLSYLASGVCWCSVLQEGVKVKLFAQMCENDRFELFCGYSVLYELSVSLTQ